MHLEIFGDLWISTFGTAGKNWFFQPGGGDEISICPFLKFVGESRGFSQAKVSPLSIFSAKGGENLMEFKQKSGDSQLAIFKLNQSHPNTPLLLRLIANSA